MTRLSIKVVPGASNSKIVGWLGDELKIRVSAPPEKGKANQAIIKLLAKQLALAPSDIKIVAGHGNSHKILEIGNIESDAIDQKLSIF